MVLSIRSPESALVRREYTVEDGLGDPHEALTLKVPMPFLRKVLDLVRDPPAQYNLQLPLPLLRRRHLQAIDEPQEPLVSRAPPYLLSAPKPPEPPESPSDDCDGDKDVEDDSDTWSYIPATHTAHAEHSEKIMNVLEPIFGKETSDRSIILLCHGKRGVCEIVPVEIPNSTEGLWRRLNHAWYDHRGVWRRWLPFTRVQTIDAVKLTIAWRHPRKATFMGTFNVIEPREEEKRLVDTIKKVSSLPFRCEYSTDDYRWDHHDSECPTLMRYFCEPEEYYRDSCPYEELANAKRMLYKRRGRRLWHLAFADFNSVASDSDLDVERFMISHGDLLRKLKYSSAPVLTELSFKGLRINESWGVGLESRTALWCMTFLFCAVIASKWIYGDWATAWNVGSFLVALTSLVEIWASKDGGQ